MGLRDYFIKKQIKKKINNLGNKSEMLEFLEQQLRDTSGEYRTALKEAEMIRKVIEAKLRIKSLRDDLKDLSDLDTDDEDEDEDEDEDDAEPQSDFEKGLMDNIIGPLLNKAKNPQNSPANLPANPGDFSELAQTLTPEQIKLLQKKGIF